MRIFGRSRPTVEELCRQGSDHFEAGEFRRAYEDWTAADDIASDPDDRAWINASLGDVLFLGGAPQAAADKLEQARALGMSDNPYVSLRYGQALFALSRRDEARTQLEQALAGGGEEMFAGEHLRYLALARGESVEELERRADAAHPLFEPEPLVVPDPEPIPAAAAVPVVQPEPEPIPEPKPSQEAVRAPAAAQHPHGASPWSPDDDAAPAPQPVTTADHDADSRPSSRTRIVASSSTRTPRSAAGPVRPGRPDRAAAAVRRGAGRTPFASAAAQEPLAPDELAQLLFAAADRPRAQALWRDLEALGEQGFAQRYPSEATHLDGDDPYTLLTGVAQDRGTLVRVARTDTDPGTIRADLLDSCRAFGLPHDVDEHDPQPRAGAATRLRDLDADLATVGTRLIWVDDDFRTFALVPVAAHQYARLVGRSGGGVTLRAGARAGQP
ncbi:hypothetical protein ACMYYO_00780 [Dermacoccaceae bacterium W4C1]